MFNTKVWVVTSRTVSMHFGFRDMVDTVGVALNKVDAEYIAWQKEKICSNSNSHVVVFEVNEISVFDKVDRNVKDFKKFSDEKIDSINSRIEKNNICKESDIQKNVLLLSELELYK